MRNGPITRYGAPPAMKAGKPDPHTCPAPALARRAHIGEEKGEKARMAQPTSGLGEAQQMRRQQCEELTNPETTAAYPRQGSDSTPIAPLGQREQSHPLVIQRPTSRLILWPPCEAMNVINISTTSPNKNCRPWNYIDWDYDKLNALKFQRRYCEL
jgi:hypothetical protein